MLDLWLKLIRFKEKHVEFRDIKSFCSTEENLSLTD